MFIRMWVLFDLVSLMCCMWLMGKFEKVMFMFIIMFLELLVVSINVCVGLKVFCVYNRYRFEFMMRVRVNSSSVVVLSFR